MFPLEIYFVLTLFLFIITISFYISKIREYNSSKSQYIILILLLIVCSIFFSNLGSFIPSDIGEPVETAIFSGFSQLLLFFSVFVFIKSFFLSDQDIIELKTPSRYRARMGTIELGKVLKNNRKKHKFFLPLKDLERHMFVCGTTGSGKSNFLQYFLTNFKKRHDIPFLLVEFKGEYPFLQDIIDDLLIVRPGENFSINIFDPEGANPEIHAERIFELMPVKFYSQKSILENFN